MCRKRTITIVCQIYYQQFTYSITLYLPFKFYIECVWFEFAKRDFLFIFLEFFFKSRDTILNFLDAW